MQDRPDDVEVEMRSDPTATSALRRCWFVVTAVGALGAAPGPAPFVDRAFEAGLDFEHFNGMTGGLYFVEHMGGGVALLDYDRDGDLDVYLTQGRLLGREASLQQATIAPRYPMPATDRLYRNDLEVRTDGSRVLRFVDVTESSGLQALEYGVGVTAGDYDNDGWVDLYLNNFGPNQMLRNNGDGTFSDVTEETGTGDRRWSVSSAFFDYDNDGWLDLYVVNYVDYRLAGHKECSSRTGMVDYCGPQAYSPVQDGFYRNRGDGTFEDASISSRLDAGRGRGLGVVTADFDSDGHLDLYVANDQMSNFLWINQGDGKFVDEALLAGCAVNESGQPEASMGVVAGDLDGDGSEDLFVVHLDRETNTLYLNDGQGLFFDASSSSGLGRPSLPFTGFGTALLDYDADGWLDLFVANGAVKRVEQQMIAGDLHPLRQSNQLFHNRAGRGFEEVSHPDHEMFGSFEVSRGVAAGDLDNDGYPDLVVVNNAGPVRLLMNQAAAGRTWLGLDVRIARGSRDALGARVTLARTGAPPLHRRLRTDGSFASSNDPRVQIGVGGSPVSLRVVWPAGAETLWREPPVGRYLRLWRWPMGEGS